MLIVKYQEVNYIQYSIKCSFEQIVLRMQNPGMLMQKRQLKIRVFSQILFQSLQPSTSINQLLFKLAVHSQVEKANIIRQITCSLQKYLTTYLSVIAIPQRLRNSYYNYDYFLCLSIYQQEQYKTIVAPIVKKIAIMFMIKSNKYFCKSNISNSQQTSFVNEKYNTINNPVLYILCLKLQEVSQIIQRETIYVKQLPNFVIEVLIVTVSELQFMLIILIIKPNNVIKKLNIQEDLSDIISINIPIHNQGKISNKIRLIIEYRLPLIISAYTLSSFQTQLIIDQLEKYEQTFKMKAPTITRFLCLCFSSTILSQISNSNSGYKSIDIKISIQIKYIQYNWILSILLEKNY
ncbi:hypothetical protein ABPG74_018658 [Tetrahymena malaccensis]